MLGRIIGYGQANELLLGMEVGTSSHWPGATVFFQRDEYGRPRSGQVVHFDSQSGKTIKDLAPNGEKRRRTTWLHKTTKKAFKRKGEPFPQWLKDYEEAEQVSGWLFGLRYVLAAAKTVPVGIVEAPKTALLCNAFLPTYRWAATCGLGNLTETRLRPLLDRKIELFPDASENGSALAHWQNKAEQLRRKGFQVTVNERLETLATPEQLCAGYDLADVILDNHRGYPPSWDNDTL
ncbi:hypothetical protein J7E24_07190 [Hymenobacter sp. ISL-91]|nr:hypothetical protein [Hymenobacter sp. ISL-91]